MTARPPPAILSRSCLQLTSARLLRQEKNGRQINYFANRSHPFFGELHSMVKKALGMDHILDSIIHRLGSLDTAIVTGDYAEGKDTGIIDIILVGNIDQKNLLDLTVKAEKYLKRKIRTLSLSPEEYSNHRDYINTRAHLVLWQATIDATCNAPL
jgi:hypothetical protein